MKLNGTTVLLVVGVGPDSCVIDEPFEREHKPHCMLVYTPRGRCYLIPKAIAGNIIEYRAIFDVDTMGDNIDAKDWFKPGSIIIPGHIAWNDLVEISFYSRGSYNDTIMRELKKFEVEDFELPSEDYDTTTFLTLNE